MKFVVFTYCEGNSINFLHSSAVDQKTFQYAPFPIDRLNAKDLDQ